MRFQFIDAERAESLRIPLRIYCKAMEVTEAGFWAWKTRPASESSKRDKVLGVAIERLFEESNGSYGSYRMHLHLLKDSFEVGRRRVARLMRELGLQGHTPRKWVKTTDSKHDHPIFENILNRKFEVPKPNLLWLTDLTYIETTEGWLYLAAVLDAFSRRVIGYAIDDHMRASLCENALKMAFVNRAPEDGCLHHSDRGSQYTCGDYQDLIAANDIITSMSRTGQCWDRDTIAVVHRIFA